MSSQAVVVRPERPGDNGPIRAVHDAAFGGPIESRIVEAVRGTPSWLPDGSLVAADRNGLIVGHLLLSSGRLVEAGGQEVEIGIIGPVGVVPDQQGRGVGSALMWHAIDVATARGLPLVCLLGHADYYPRFGFEPARGIGVEPPHPWPDPNWLALRLSAWKAGLRGRVRFPPAFPDR